MKSQSDKVIRCAIYTRKSTEEGLELEFNSLDAQRDSGESYIASQKNEGWVCNEEQYNDGGFTGGNIERPALKRLMIDIEAGMVDCVVVYKVDRLSRSLMDFSRLMETFDKHGVSFVSVTQQFNTTHSMGRLTLNILLSFAQFEREIISERTRDKIAAARRKGKWAGGRPLLGYDLVPGPGGSKLIVNEPEAKRVREVYDLYLTLGSLMPVVQECQKRGWTTKSWTSKAGKPQGGKTLDKGAVFAMLTNVGYIGKVRHHDDIFEGEHGAIVDIEVYDRVRAQLSLNGRTGGSRIRNRHGALLKGLVRCEACDCAMVHHFSSVRKGKATKRYHYYVCRKAQAQGWASCPSPALPAGDLEQFVIDQIRVLATDEATASAIVNIAEIQLRARDPNTDIDRDELMGAVQMFDQVWEALTQREHEHLIHAVVKCISWDAEHESVSLTFHDLIEPNFEEDAA